MATLNLKTALVGSLAAAALMAGSPASALTINLIDIGGVTGSQAQVGFNVAARYWESVLTNNATVNLNVGYSALGPGVLGSTSSSLLESVTISSYEGALAATQTSTLDATAVAHLAPLSGGAVNVLVPGYDTPGLGIDDDAALRVAPSAPISKTIALTTANAKAFGVNFGNIIDGQVQFSNTFAFDFNPTNGISAGQYDFIGVAVHEIGHALGFISGADDFDYSDGYTGPVDNIWWGYGLDMFRYSAPGQLNWAPGVDSYFSIDGGATAYQNGLFSTGTNFGDGNQASHWKEPNQASPCTNFRGIMNPYICGGTGDSVSGLDLAAFDAIGWNLAAGARDNTSYAFTTAQMFQQFATTGVPEPSGWALMIMGFGLVGAMVRRRGRALAATA